MHRLVWISWIAINLLEFFNQFVKKALNTDGWSLWWTFPGRVITSDISTIAV